MAYSVTYISIGSDGGIVARSSGFGFLSIESVPNEPDHMPQRVDLHMPAELARTYAAAINAVSRPGEETTEI